MARLTTPLPAYPARGIDTSHLALLAFQAGVIGFVALLIGLAIVNTVLGTTTGGGTGYTQPY